MDVLGARGVAIHGVVGHMIYDGDRQNILYNYS